MRIYFLGVAGTAMGNAALLLRDLGHETLGSDQAVYPPMSDYLQEAGVEILEGYDARRLERLKPELVVVGNAFSRGNEEVEWLLDTRAIPFVSLPEALGRFALRDRMSIVVAGTHGKTTTTALTAFLLEEAGVEPGYLIGGAPIDPAKGWSNGGADGPFVIEGDEYDSAFFDKRSKFIHYRPRIAVVNNLEFDHADIFRDLEDVKRSLRHFLALVPRSGFVLANGDDENVRSLLPLPWTQVLKVGLGEACDLRIDGYQTTETGSRFRLLWRRELWGEVEWGMTGLFNARNAAMASLAAALASGMADDPRRFDLGALARFRGVRRRQETRLATQRLLISEDFGHHPTAIGETLTALRARYAGWRLVAAFEPRSNTSRLEAMRQPMTEALARADKVVLGEAKKSSQPGVELVDTASMAEALSQSGVEAVACAQNADGLEYLKALVEDQPDRRQVVVFFTNGSFGGIIGRFVGWARQREGEPGSDVG